MSTTADKFLTLFQPAIVAVCLMTIGPTTAVAQTPAAEPEEEILQPSVPVPDEEAVTEARKRVRELFAQEFNSRDSEQQQALARQLKQAAAESTQPPEAYAMLTEARDLAARTGEIELMLETIDNLTQRFEADPLAVRESAFRTARRNVRDPEKAGQLILAMMAWARDAEDQDAYESAISMARMAVATASEARIPGTGARELVTHLTQLAREHGRLASARRTLETQPEDPAANLRMGQFYAFAKEDWQRGLKHLIHADDEDLAAAAKADLAGAKKPEPQAEIGDLWWEWGQRQRGRSQDGALARGITWYQQALDGLSGLRRMEIEKRIAAYFQEHGEALVEGDLALAERGARADAPRGAEYLIDGQVRIRGRRRTFARGAWPCDFIVRLDQAYPLKQIRFLLYQRRGPKFRYAIATSVDGQNWLMLADRTNEPSEGWQTFDFSPRRVRFIRIHGTHNSNNRGFQIVEVEAYSVPPK
ncbi:MAG: discoidin domain-containing protein [Phycisphaeraceae bacterium]|nr:discoidin domain-containing protein [Phycisphaeraceae bacterium]